MTRRHRLLSALFLLTSVVAAACGPETVRVTPAPTAAPSSAAPTATPSRTPTAPGTTAAATATAAPAPSASSGSTPAAACPALTGGSTANRVILTDVRIAHNPGFDRLVFEFGPNPGPGTYGVPPYRIEVASTFTAVSGQPVTVAGSAFFAVNFQMTDAHNPNTGQQSLPASKLDNKPGTPLIKEVRIVEDFEAVNRWAVGLDHLVCPAILTLSGPVRVVLDFPTPP